ncbi:hypothetical protein KR009_011520 [Drosophila setifemur]|nr:hypothetical protein KR009_011520 [Drosophila setifemur]
MSSSTPGSDVAATPSPSPLAKADVDFSGSKFEINSALSDEERRFYLKMYPTVDLVNQRKVHCTVCRLHLGSAPVSENNIKMHPILRVTHCVKCHEFYNSGEFSKGEDGSELYCRWCGQGGEVYCCSTCPYVFCKSCIVKNLSKGVIVDIEQNEHWNCFSCTSKILWPLRAQHWALVNYIQTQKRALQGLQLPEVEIRRQMLKDNSSCCRLAKSKASSLSDSMESLESNASKRSHGSSVSSLKRAALAKSSQAPPSKRPKSSNDEVVCTPDLLSMLEPDCQISMSPKGVTRPPVPSTNITTTPRIITVQQNYTGPRPSSTSGSNGSGSTPIPVGQPRSTLPPPLVLSGSGIRYRQNAPGAVSNVVRRTVVPNTVRNTGPVFHTINGFRVDLNSAAQQDSYRLPNGRLIQVKRQIPQATPPPAPPVPLNIPPLGPGVVIRPTRPALPAVRQQVHGGNGGNAGVGAAFAGAFGNNIGIFNPQTNQQQRAPQIVRIGSVNPAAGAPQPTQPPNVNGTGTIMVPPHPPTKIPSLVRHVFPGTTMGNARAQLQEQIFSAMDICTHLTGKVVSLTHSNAYNQARSYLDLKELYIHMSYLMTYAIGRFKHLQEKCLVDMREMGFKNDANSLENGQLAAEKQASDDEDNEIEIVEPKTDTITIDSDNEEDSPSPSKIQSQNQKAIMKITSVTSAAPKTELDIDVAAFSSTILASLLEVDINESPTEPKSISPSQKKQPRKKTTNKPNPALLQLERKRMEEIRKSDAKLKMKVVVKLRRAEEEFEVARKWADANKKSKQEKLAREQGNTEASKNQNEAKNKPVTVIQVNEKSPIKEKVKEPLELKETQTKKMAESNGDLNESSEKPVSETEKDTEIEVPVEKESETIIEDIVDKESEAINEIVVQHENNEITFEIIVEKEKEITEEVTVETEKPDEEQTTTGADTDQAEAVEDEEIAAARENLNTGVSEDVEISPQGTGICEDVVITPQEQLEEDLLNELIEEQDAIGDEEALTENVRDEIEDTEKEDIQEEFEQVVNEIVHALDSSNDKVEALAAELVGSMDVSESLETPKELIDCALDDDIGMDGIELSDATEELIKSLSSSSPMASEGAKENETDVEVDANDLIQTLPLETAEPPEILLRDDECEVTLDTAIESSMESLQSAGNSTEDAPSTAQILG